jgi:hypothetical protein
METTTAGPAIPLAHSLTGVAVVVLITAVFAAVGYYRGRNAAEDILGSGRYGYSAAQVRGQRTLGWGLVAFIPSVLAISNLVVGMNS